MAAMYCPNAGSTWATTGLMSADASPFFGADGNLRHHINREVYMRLATTIAMTTTILGTCSAAIAGTAASLESIDDLYVHLSNNLNVDTGATAQALAMRLLVDQFFYGPHHARIDEASLGVSGVKSVRALLATVEALEAGWRVDPTILAFHRYLSSMLHEMEGAR